MYEQEFLTAEDLPGGNCWQKDELGRGRKFYGPPSEPGAYKQLQARVAETEERKRTITATSASVAVHEVLHAELT